MYNKAIGIFDSGLGGLTVAKEILKILPNENIIYFGDTARVPYGIKSKSTIIRYSKEIVKFLEEKGVKAIVVACNTVTAMAIKEIKASVNIPVIGVIEPGSKKAVKTTKSKEIGVIGTVGTITSGSYPKEIKKIDSTINVHQKACPLFVPLIEEGLINDFVTLEIANRYLQELKGNIDTLVLGCTHYPLIKKIISEVLGHKVSIIDSAEQTAIELKKVLEEKKLTKYNEKPKVEYYLSDLTKTFAEIGEMFLSRKIDIKVINIEEYCE